MQLIARITIPTIDQISHLIWALDILQKQLQVLKRENNQAVKGKSQQTRNERKDGMRGGGSEGAL